MTIVHDELNDCYTVWRGNEWIADFETFGAAWDWCDERGYRPNLDRLRLTTV